MNYACPAHSLVPQQNDRVCEVALESFLHEVTAVKCLIFSGIEAALTPASRVRDVNPQLAAENALFESIAM